MKEQYHIIFRRNILPSRFLRCVDLWAKLQDNAPIILHAQSENQRQFHDSWKDSLGKDNAVAFTLLQGQKDSPNQTQDTYH